MKIWSVRFALAVVLVSCFYLQTARAQQSAEAPLTNASVIKLVRAGFKEKTVIAIIRTRPARFDLAPDRLIELKRGGVSENIILAMLARDDSILLSDDAWSDDPFFNDSSGSGRTGKSQGAGEGSTDIFGSSGGSSARTRGRGLNGGNEGDTQTTGSATVRMLRPPVEAVRAAPQLKRRRLSTIFDHRAGSKRASPGHDHTPHRTVPRRF